MDAAEAAGAPARIFRCECGYASAAAWLTESIGRGQADAWSHLDLHVANIDEHLESLLDKIASGCTNWWGGRADSARAAIQRTGGRPLSVGHFRWPARGGLEPRSAGFCQAGAITRFAAQSRVRAAGRTAQSG